MDGEQALRIEPAMLRDETGACGERLEFVDRVLVRILGMDGLACSELEMPVSHAHALTLAADEMHFDAARGRIVVCAMLELRKIEVAAKLAVDAREHVEVERGGHALSVV